MANSNINILFRKIHHWGSILVALPVIVIIASGMLLNLKKEIEWVQPPTQKGVSRIPTASFEDLMAAAQSVSPTTIRDWTDLARVDVKPDKGVVKFITHDNWEIQIDAKTAAVLQVSYRRSDIIETIHDGSFFAGWTKHYLFLPAAVILFVLWLTGIYMFFRPYFKRAKRRRGSALREGIRA